MAPRKRKVKSTSKRKGKKSVDPLFHPIKAQIEAARNRLRQAAKRDAKLDAKRDAKRAAKKVHHRYLKLKKAHRLLGFGPLDNITI